MNAQTAENKLQLGNSGCQECQRVVLFGDDKVGKTCLIKALKAEIAHVAPGDKRRRDDVENNVRMAKSAEFEFIEVPADICKTAGTRDFVDWFADQLPNIDCIVLAMPCTEETPSYGSQVFIEAIYAALKASDHKTWSRVVLVGTKADRLVAPRDKGWFAYSAHNQASIDESIEELIEFKINCNAFVINNLGKVFQAAPDGVFDKGPAGANNPVPLGNYCLTGHTAQDCLNVEPFKKQLNAVKGQRFQEMSKEKKESLIDSILDFYVTDMWS